MCPDRNSTNFVWHNIRNRKRYYTLFLEIQDLVCAQRRAALWRPPGRVPPAARRDRGGTSMPRARARLLTAASLPLSWGRLLHDSSARALASARPGAAPSLRRHRGEHGPCVPRRHTVAALSPQPSPVPPADSAMAASVCAAARIDSRARTPMRALVGLCPRCHPPAPPGPGPLAAPECT